MLLELPVCTDRRVVQVRCHPGSDVELRTYWWLCIWLWKTGHIILFYNSTKGGMDALDQLCATYCTKRKTLRRPLSLFFTFLDIAAVNASIVLHPPSVDVTTTRYHDRWRQILIEIGHGLTKPWLQERSSIRQVTCHAPVRAAMTRMGALEEDDRSNAVTSTYRKRGPLCGRRKEQKVASACCQCKRFVCSSHSSKTDSYRCAHCSAR